MRGTLLYLCVLATMVVCGPAMYGQPSSAPAAAPESMEVYREMATGIEFPQQLAKFERGEVKAFEDPALGVGIGYSRETANVTLYIFDGGVKDIGRGIESPAVKMQFERAKRDIAEAQKRGLYEALEQTAEMEAAIGDAERGFPVLVSSYRLTIDKEAVISHIYLTGCRSRFVKVRITYPASDREKYAPQVADFLTALGQTLLKADPK